MRRWLREPLVHFLLLGAALFALDASTRGRSTAPAEDEIVVEPGRVENLAALFTKTWQRLPTPEELRGLVQDHVLEEALVREGLALGLDRDDTMVRRRLRQKMEFLVEDLLEEREPTEVELQAWLAERAADYAFPARLRFRQVYLNPDRRGESVRRDAEALLAELRAGEAALDASALGDATLLGHAFDDLAADELARTFGADFAERLAALPVGEWAGPLESPYGLHLVRVDGVTPGRVPELAEVRGAVERDWRFARREEARARFHAELLSRYRVRVEWPDGGAVATEE